MNAYEKLVLGLLAIAGLAVSLAMSSDAASAATSTVAVGDIYFCSAVYEGDVCTTTVSVGDTVVWDFSGADVAHTVTECGTSCDNPASAPIFESGVVQAGGDSFQFTFASAGTYNYYCQIHALSQRGKVVVQPASVAPTGGGTPTLGVTLPPTGYGAHAGASSTWWAFGALAGVGVALMSFGALAFARGRAK